MILNIGTKSSLESLFPKNYSEHEGRSWNDATDIF